MNPQISSIKNPLGNFNRKKSIIYWLILGAVVLVIVGIIWWSWSITSKIDDIKPVEIPNRIDKSIDTSVWQTYRSEEYEFEVKYPKDWSIDRTRSQLPGIVVFDIGIEESHESIEANENIHNIALEQWPDRLFGDKRVIYSQSVLQVAGEKALRLDTTEFGQTIIVALHKNYVYIFRTGGRIIEEGILSTFKFIKK